MRRHDYQIEEMLRLRVKAEPRRPEVHRELGAWLARSGRLCQAREALQTGLAQVERTASLQHLLGLILAGAGDFEGAERHLSRAVELEPARFEFLRDHGFVQGAAGRTASSVETLRQAMSVGGDAGADLAWMIRLGERALAESGAKAERRPPQPPRRAAIIERIVSRDPEIAEALTARFTGLPEKAPAASPEDRETLRAARRALTRLLAHNPAYPDLHFGLSLVAEQLGEVDRAIEAAEKALAINPRYVEACLLAVRLYERNGQPEQAAERCRQATRLRPRWVDAHVRLGHLLREQGKPHEAADAYRTAIEIDSACDEARRQLDGLQAALASEGGAA